MLNGANKINITKTPNLAAFALRADSLASKLTQVYQTAQYTGYKLNGAAPNPKNHFIMTANSKSLRIGVCPKAAKLLKNFSKYDFVPSCDEDEFHTLVIREDSTIDAENLICGIIKTLM